jgi:hypothetical protein
MKLPRPPFTKLERRLTTLRAELLATLGIVEGKLAEIGYKKSRTRS